MQNPEPNTCKIAKLEPNILIDKIENGEKVPIYLLLSEFQNIEAIWRRAPSEIRPRVLARPPLRGGLARAANPRDRPARSEFRTNGSNLNV